MAYTFYTRRLNGEAPHISDYPAFVLVETKWNDYNFITQFVLNYYLNSRKKEEVGYIKVLERDKMQTNLPSLFDSLPERYCSLGQTLEFYKFLLENFSKADFTSILRSLNDISQNKAIQKKFKNAPGMKESLLRSSEAQKAFSEVPQLIKGLKTRNIFHFEFSTQIPGFLIPHKVSFKFTKSSPLPKRIAAIIGKNGSGKTQYLAKLASSMSGLSERGIFSDGSVPPFSRVIAISYSLFDRFEKPRSSKSFSYFFCGFQSDKDFDSIYVLERRLNRALSEIKEFERIVDITGYLSTLIGQELTDQYINQISDTNKNRYNFLFTKELHSKLSSGQMLMIIIFTEILAYIRPESVLLFDEPETHLHPNAISSVIGILNDLLIKYDSFAVIATHSPQIIQEIPSSLIYYFDADKKNPPVHDLTLETFGENLTTLTERIFDTLDQEPNYKSVLQGLSKRYSKRDLTELLEKNVALSFNAKAYIEYLYSKNEES